MCGICGVAGDVAEIPDLRARLVQMTRSLTHRGPDSEGLLVRPGVGLGVRRLAIVDPVGGDQPIVNEDESIAIVCNGEIYNAPELRTELEGRGHRFRTGSDVEVILHLYEERGIDCVHALRGMFAIALWDGDARRLVLIRDRLGIKPLHYAQTGDSLIFGSELKAVLASGLVNRSLEPEAVRDLFSFGFVLTPRTLAGGIVRLPPGHLLVFASDRLVVRRYWEPSFPDRESFDHHGTDDELVEAFAAKLEETVAVHLRSDVEVGAWLSPGLDSSAVALLAANRLEHPLQTFSIAFDDSTIDEVGALGTLADTDGARYRSRRVRCGPTDLARIDEAVWHSEAPSLSLIEIPRMILAEGAAQEVKVVLTGEGADEVLGGYRWYHGEKVFGPVAALPGWLRRLGSLGPIGRRFRPGVARLLEAPASMDLERFRSMVAPRDWPVGRELLREIGRGDPAPALDPPPPPDFERWHPFSRLQYLDLRVRLPDLIIHTLDRATMARSLEARVPFLDHELAEMCFRLPPSIKMRGLQEKYVLRKAMAGRLPRPIVRRGKQGMETPVATWFRGEIPEVVAETLSPSSLRSAGLFDPAAVGRLLKRHRSGRADHGRQLAGVVALQIWRRHFLESDGSAPTV